MNDTYRIALLPGDGIGPDVVTEAVKVLRAVEPFIDANFDFTELSVGAGEYLRSGDPLPEATFLRLKEFDAILLGAMGLPGVRWADGTEMTPQIDLREKLDLYCGIRPIRLYHEAHSPMKGVKGGEIDFLILRENTEGLFFSRLNKPKPDATEVRDTMRISRDRSERLFRSAFAQARKRRKHVTLVDKANVLPSMAFFRRIFDEVAEQFPDVQTSRVYVDAASLYLVQRPQTFDVLVTENMFGDILSDLAAGLVGGMGMAPSADVGEGHAVFQPSHGTAPDIAGKGIANPIATILSASMMLEWLGLREASEAINRAVERVHVRGSPYSGSRGTGPYRGDGRSRREGTARVAHKVRPEYLNSIGPFSIRSRQSASALLSPRLKVVSSRSKSSAESIFFRSWTANFITRSSLPYCMANRFYHAPKVLSRTTSPSTRVYAHSDYVHPLGQTARLGVSHPHACDCAIYSGRHVGRAFGRTSTVARPLGWSGTRCAEP